MTALSQKLLSGDGQKVSGIHVEWMVHSQRNRYLYYALCLITGGILHIVCAIYPSFKRWITSRKCLPLQADSAIVSFPDEEMKIVEVKLEEVDGEPIVTFEANCKRYWSSASCDWSISSLPDVPDQFSRFITDSRLSKPSRQTLLALYGPNTMQLPTVSFTDTLAVIMAQPFYIFQYFAVILWMVENYVLYACVIILITGGAIYLTTSETIFNLRRLHDLAGKGMLPLHICH